MGNSSKRLLTALAAMLGAGTAVPAAQASPILQQQVATIPKAQRKKPVVSRPHREVPKTPKALAARYRAGDKRRAKQIRRAHNRTIKRAADRMTWRAARELAGRWTDRRSQVRQ